MIYCVKQKKQTVRSAFLFCRHLCLSQFGVLFAAFLVPVPKAVNFADIACSGERVDFVVVDVFHQFCKLVLAQQGFELDAFLAAVAASHLIERTSALQFVDDVLTQAVVILRHNTDALFVVERSGEIVDHKAINPSAYKTNDNHTERVDGKGGAADYCPSH